MSEDPSGSKLNIYYSYNADFSVSFSLLSLPSLSLSVCPSSPPSFHPCLTPFIFLSVSWVSQTWHKKLNTRMSLRKEGVRDGRAEKQYLEEKTAHGKCLVLNPVGILRNGTKQCIIISTKGWGKWGIYVATWESRITHLFFTGMANPWHF